MNKLQTALVASMALAGPSLALAAGTVSYDVSEATPYFVALIAAITVIGGAKLAPAAVAVGFKWLKATIFG